MRNIVSVVVNVVKLLLIENNNNVIIKIDFCFILFDSILKISVFIVILIELILFI